MSRLFECRFFSLALIILCFGQPALAQNKISNIDFSFQYKIHSELRADIYAITKDSVSTILIKFNASQDSLKKFKVRYSLINKLDEEILTMAKIKNLSSYFQFEDKYGAEYGFRLKTDGYKYIVLWLADTTRSIRYPYVKLLARSPQSNSLVLEYINLNTSIYLRYLPVNSIIKANNFEPEVNIKIDYYDYNFKPAHPPMTLKKDSLTAPFAIESWFEVGNRDSILLSKKGLYFIHSSNSLVGKSIITRDNNFPKFSKIERLVESLVYLTTEEEYLKMSTSFKKKELFDKFWLNNTKSEAKAKKGVKEYYKRVREANTLFTSYKEGWKTDMGMLYIIFGPPSKVFLKNDGIMWIYSKTFELPRIAFFFNHINTALSEEHYVLVRNAEYQNLWFRTIDLWRSGRKEF